jgi:hypothetical protein
LTDSREAKWNWAIKDYNLQSSLLDYVHLYNWFYEFYLYPENTSGIENCFAVR